MSRYDGDSLGMFTSNISKSNKGYAMNEKDRAELEQTRRMVENLEREFDGGSSDYQPTIKKTTSTVGYTQNPIKSSRRDEKKKDDVDELLDLIEGATSDKKKPTPSYQNTSWTNTKADDKPDKNKSSFLDELVEDGDEPSTSFYIPSTSQSRIPRSNKLNSDLKNKMGQLFGIKSEENPTPLQRPFTSDGGRGNQTTTAKASFNNTGFSDFTPPANEDAGGIDTTEDFSMPFSRLKTRGKTLRDRDTNRPFTSPGEFGKEEKVENSRAGAASNISNVGGFENMNNFDSKSQRVKDETIEEEEPSDYIPTGMGRPLSRGGAGDRKAKSRLNLDSEPSIQKEIPRKSPISNMGDDARSDTQSILPLRNHQIGEATGMGDNTTTMTPSMNYLGVENTNLHRRAQSNQADTDHLKPPLSKFDEKMASLMRGTGSSMPIPQAYPRTEASLPAFDNEMARHGPVIQQEKSFLGEDTIKKLLKDTEDYYKSMNEDLKKYHKEEKERWETAHAKEVEILKKEKQLLMDQMEVSLQRERDRLKELHSMEMQSKDKMHSYELERQKHMLEEQAESLKKQLEAQVKLNALADEIRTSSNRLQTLSDKIETEKRQDGSTKRQELEQRERLIEEKEMKIKSDLNVLEREKQRYDKLFMDLDEKENETLRKIDREKELIAQEYRRLGDMQESLKSMELEKRRELTSEKSQLENMRIKLEKESIELKDEFRKKYQDLEIQITLFNDQKKDMTRSNNEEEAALKRKHDEVDALRKKLSYEEAELLKKLKNAETRELHLIKQIDELQTKLDLFNMEKSTFEKEKEKVFEIARRAREDSEMVNKFKREFDMEKEKNQRMKIELDSYATTLQNERLKIDEEKSSMNLLQKTLEGIRYGYVKEYNSTTGPGSKPPIASTRVTGQSFHPRATAESPNHLRRASATGLVNSSSITNLQEYPEYNRGTEVRGSEMRGTERSEQRRDPSVRRPSSSKTFDLVNYMEGLKHLDRSSTINKDYIVKEKESLIRSKVDFETGHLTRVRSGSRDSFGVFGM